MKVAIPYWLGRVSPVFDVARDVVIADIENGREVKRSKKSVTREDPLMRARQISETGAEVLICGAISRPLKIALMSSGVKVIAHICGSVDDVILAYLNDHLDDRAFLMPGCTGQHSDSRLFREGNPTGKNEDP